MAHFVPLWDYTQISLTLYPSPTQFLILYFRVLPRRFRKPKPLEHPLNPLSPFNLPDRAGIP
jgi:hypothetical protein